MPKVFLDKLVTSAHFPPADGSRGYCSTTVFPDLSHTMLSTSFCPPKTAAITPKGEMTRIFKQQSFRRYQACERGAAEARYIPKFFKRASSVFSNKVLIDLEQTKLARNERRNQIWARGKTRHGFAGLGSRHEESMDGVPRGASLSLAHSAGADTAWGRPATTYGREAGGAGSSFFLAPSDGRLGGHEGEADGFLFDAGLDRSQWGNDYAEDGFDAEFELATPVLAATALQQAAVADRPATSAQKAASRTHTAASPPPRDASVEDTRVGMAKNLTGERNPLIAEEEAKWKSQGADLGDIAYGIVGRASAKRREEEAARRDATSPAAVPLESGGDDAAARRWDELEQNQHGVPDSSAGQTLLPAASRAGGSPSLRARNKRAKGLPPARPRLAFSRASYFECLLDSLDIPEPNAPRFGMLQSPGKSPEQQKEQRRAQTAGFEPRTRTADRAAALLPASPIKAGEQRFFPDENHGYAHAGALVSAQPSVETLLADTSPGNAAGAGAAKRRPAPQELSQGSLRDVLARMSTANSAARGGRAAGASRASAADLRGVVPSAKWRTEAVARALTGDTYGEYKARVYQ